MSFRINEVLEMNLCLHLPSLPIFIGWRRAGDEAHLGFSPESSVITRLGRSSGSGFTEILPIDEAKNFTQQW
jgi:hypothetical protein